MSAAAETARDSGSAGDRRDTLRRAGRVPWRCCRAASAQRRATWEDMALQCFDLARCCCCWRPTNSPRRHSVDCWQWRRQAPRRAAVATRSSPARCVHRSLAAAAGCTPRERPPPGQTTAARAGALRTDPTDGARSSSTSLMRRTRWRKKYQSTCWSCRCRQCCRVDDGPAGPRAASAVRPPSCQRRWRLPHCLAPWTMCSAPAAVCRDASRGRRSAWRWQRARPAAEHPTASALRQWRCCCCCCC
mmetsp:Transcript_13298/g.40149  ORF Transcript_13298/g.40149 Transcript_13298/m.40149 type:complete len:246 (-) Transcript_13298:92-829(-)